jgi:hypothetical protein
VVREPTLAESLEIKRRKNAIQIEEAADEDTAADHDDFDVNL